MKSHSILTALRSIRTQFGLVTACILLVLLSAFYLGGRFIVVQMIRQAEQDIQTTGNDIKSIVYGELVHLQQASDQSADELSRSADELTNDFLQSRLGSFSDVGSPINLAFGLTVGGTFKNGCALFPGEPLHLVDVSELQPYFSSSSPLPVSLRNGKSASGIIVFNNRPAFFAISPVKAPAGTLRGFIVLGSLLHNATLITRINAAARGMPVSLSNRPTGRAHATVAAGQQAGQTPVFQDILTYPSGGRWHLGENAFEEIIPINDILGREVAYISIRLPGSFASLASLALGWLTCFIACVGIVFVLPIFWLQTRIVLNPLSNLTRQIRQLGEHHLDGDCEAIRWTKKDEFGLLAQSVNELLSALANKTQQHAQGEQRQRALIAGMPDCLCVFDNQANVVTIYKQPDYANPIPGLIAGRPLSPPLFPDTDCEALRIAIGETFTTDRIQMVIVSCRESDGSYRHFETRISRMDEFFVLVVLRDVTKEWREREAREQVEERLIKVQKMESLGTLAAGIAHDFNNILAIIQNTVDLIDESPVDSEHDAVGTIRQATAKGAALTRELMTYAGHTQIALKRQDPNTLILDLQKLMHGVIASNIILELKLTPSLPPVDIDPHQFWKVIINLLKNASESLNGSSGHIRISTYPFTLSAQNADDFFSTHAVALGPGVVFQIDDSGSGISKEVIDRMFEPFFSTKAVGRGLGLATVFGIVDAHNGGIAIASEPGKGTSFRVWLPETAEPAAAPPPPHTQTAATSHALAVPAAQSASSLPCVLLVEDDRSILQSTRILLRSLNVEALAASTQHEALALFRKHSSSICLILLDAQIGRLDNVRLLTTLRMRKPGVPAVILSGHTEEKIREMFRSETYNGFLSKPYTRGELKEILVRFACIK